MRHDDLEEMSNQSARQALRSNRPMRKLFTILLAAFVILAGLALGLLQIWTAVTFRGLFG